MKTFVRLAVAGALITGAHGAFAQALPSSNNADLWLFVSDQAAGTTFAEDTGISLNSLLPASDLTTAATTGPVAVGGTNIDLTASSALTSYIDSANTAGQSLEWAVEGVQFNGSATKAVVKNPGGAIGIASAALSFSSGVGQLQEGNLAQWAGSFQGDAQYLATTYAAGGKSYTFTAGTTTTNVWGAQGTGNVGGSTDLYGNGILQAGTGLGGVVSLFGATGGGTTGNLETYDLTDNLTLSATGTLQSVAPVPVPAAVWLFGSGLLGLIGVGRRRAA
jgi:hypothetical protein